MYYSKEDQITYQIDKLIYHFKKINNLGALDYAIERLKFEGIYLTRLKEENKEQSQSRFKNLELDNDTKIYKENLLFKEEDLKNITSPYIEVFIPNLATPEYREEALKALNDFFSNENVKKVKYCIKIKQPTDGTTEEEIINFLTYLQFDLIKFYDNEANLYKIFYNGKIGYPLNRMNEIIKNLPSSTLVYFTIEYNENGEKQPIKTDINNLIDTINYYKQFSNLEINFKIENIGYFNGKYFYLDYYDPEIILSEKLKLFRERYKRVYLIDKEKRQWIKELLF